MMNWNLTRTALIPLACGLSLAACQQTAAPVSGGQSNPQEDSQPVQPLSMSASASQKNSTMQNEMIRIMQTMQQQMQRVSMTATTADHHFAAGMIPHHEGAVAMAQAELKYGADPAVRSLAQSIINQQSAEIRTLQQWLASHPQQNHTAGAASHDMSAMSGMNHDMGHQQHGQMASSSNMAMTSADAIFAQHMIPHHQMAIDMAQSVLAHGNDPHLQKMARQIIIAQQGEIDWLNSWLAHQATSDEGK